MNTQPAPKNFTLIDTLGQMGFRLCLFGLIGFLGSLSAQLMLGYDTTSSPLTYQLLISCWGFAAAGGMLFVGSQFVIGPHKRKKPKTKISPKDTAHQLALLGSRYRVFNGIDIQTASGRLQPVPHIAIGPNGLFYLAPLETITSAQETAIQELLWSKSIRNTDITSIALPTPRLAQTIQQHRCKRRLSAAEITRIATLIESNSQPSKEKSDPSTTPAPLVWMVPFALFALVMTWIIMDNRTPEL